METVGVADLRQLSKDLSAASGDSFRQTAASIVSDAARQTEIMARAYAPRRTGALSNSIGTTFSDQGMTASVGTMTKYAKYMEFGTASRSEFGGSPYVIVPKKAKYLKFTVQGRTIYTKKVIHPGVKSRPFLRPALERIVVPFENDLKTAAIVSIVTGPHTPKALEMGQ